MIDMDPDLDVSSHFIPEQQLIVSVIATAMRDACIKPYTPFGEKRLQMTFDCMTAHDFLWTEALESYLHYLDIEAAYFRKSLLNTMANDSEKTIGQFSSENRRAFRVNKRLWDAQQSGGLVKPLADPEADEWKSVDPAIDQKLRRSAIVAGTDSNAGTSYVTVSQDSEGV